MPTSEDILIADELVTALNGAAFSIAFSAERLYVSDWDVKEELAALQVGVWPAESAGELWERAQFQESFRTGVSFAQRIAKASLADVDALMDLVDEVKDFVAPKDGPNVVTIPDGRQYVNDGWEYLARFAANRLDRKLTDAGNVEYTGMFASVLAFDFTAME